MTHRRFIALLFALFFGFLSLFPYVLHPLHPGFQGMTAIRDKDYGNYESRLGRALHGYPREADNGITPAGSGIDGAQIAGMEILIGTLFSWTGLGAPTLAVILTPFFVVAFVLLLEKLLRTLDLPRTFSLGVTTLYTLITFHVVARVMHPGWSFVPLLLTLLCFLHCVQKPSFFFAVLSGVLLGVLPYLYFWHWTFAWAFAGSAILLELCAGREKKERNFSFLPLVIAILIAIPFFLQTSAIFASPYHAALALRGGFLQTHGMESVPRSVLLTLEVLLLLSLFPHFRKEWSYRIVVALVLGVFIALHQNVIHGTLLMFTSHYEPHFVLVSLIAGAWVLHRRVPLLQRVGVSLIALLFLGGAGVDYLPGYRYFLPRDAHFEEQHLAGAIDLLQKNETKETVLTDGYSGRVVTAWTPDGIVYTAHMRFLLIADEEMAERYCLSELFSPELPSAHRALYMEYNALIDSPAVRAEEQRLVTEACLRVREEPAPYLQKYGVTHVLWNKEVKPRWRNPSDVLPLKRVKDSPTWSLFAVPTS